MGARKNNRATMVKTAKKTTYFAKLVNVPTSPRKMRLVADMVRGKNINEALAMLKYSPKEASNRVYKLLLSAIAIGKLRMRDQDLRMLIFLSPKYL